MKIPVSIEGRSWRRPRRLVLIGAVVLALAIPAGVWASHQFTDVPDSQLFHAQIGAIADAGITTGCGDGNYCPDQFVRRDAMAAFMHRGYGRVGAAGVNGLSVAPGVDTAVLSKSIVVGLPAGARAGAAQFVSATGTVSLFASSAASCTTGGPVACYFQVWLTLDGTLMNSSNYVTLANGQTGMVNISTTGVGRVTTSGTHTVVVHVLEYLGATSVFAYGNLSVANAPFGSTGANTLAAPASTTGARPGE